MPTYRLTVAYDGSAFVGWQQQAHGASVQEALQHALRMLLGHEVFCRAAGRTDAGVHAMGQVVSFVSPRTMPPTAFQHGMRHYLPSSIAVLAASIAADDFDARFSASGKLYRYQIWNAPVRSPLQQATHWHVRFPLDRQAMQEAAQHLVGRHDFASFRAANCERKTTVRTLHRVELRVPVAEEPALHIEVEGTAFLKYMVRNLVGTLVEVGKRRMKPARMAEVLASCDRTQAGPTAPPHGLILWRVDFGPRVGY